MNISFMMRRSRLPIASLVISQLLLGAISPVLAQSRPDSQTAEEPTLEEFAPLEQTPPNGNRFTNNRRDLGPSPADNIPVYLLGPGDDVRFDVFNVPELTNDESGNRL
ncbi:MAG: hypothetical protein AAF892_02635, partial [Cyanobacteria bacterium P01_D01_bin.71]